MADIWDRVDVAIDTDPLLLRDIVGELLVSVRAAERACQMAEQAAQRWHDDYGRILAERDALKAAGDRARACHPRDDSNPRGPWCPTCLTVWPCATRRALDGGQ